MIGKKINNRLIGKLCEYIAYFQLKKNGFEVVQFGKAVEDDLYSGKQKLSFPIIPDQNVGYSRADFQLTRWYDNHNYRKYTRPLKSQIPIFFDYTDSEIRKLALLCKEKFPCRLCANMPEEVPCYRAEKMFDLEWLDSINAWAKSYVLKIDDHTKIVGENYNLIADCQSSLGEIAIRNVSDAIFNQSHFIRDNQRIHRYIENEWYDFDSSKIELTPSENEEIGREYQLFQKSGVKTDRYRELCRKVDQLSANYFGAGHPGRYDFMGYKDGVFYAFEVKGNRGRLSYWQKVRMGLLKRMGYNCYVIRVILNLNSITTINKIPKDYEISWELFNCDIELPSRKTFDEKINRIYAWQDKTRLSKMNLGY